VLLFTNLSVVVVEASRANRRKPPFWALVTPGSERVPPAQAETRETKRTETTTARLNFKIATSESVEPAYATRSLRPLTGDSGHFTSNCLTAACAAWLTRRAACNASRRFDTRANIIYYADIMPKGEYLGEFEHIVLLTVLRLGEGAYGAVVRSEIERVTGRSPAIGAVHATLDRLERKGLVSSWIGEPTAARGGKAKRHFKIEADGTSALKSAQQTLERLHAGISLRCVTA
jgi:PadR family transcriptional regulator PadR